MRHATVSTDGAHVVTRGENRDGSGAPRPVHRLARCGGELAAGESLRGGLRCVRAGDGGIRSGWAGVFLIAQDGYRTSLPLQDLLAKDVLLADRLDGQALGLAHGAPLRLVVPAHYGYKNVKHLRAVELCRDAVIDKGPLGNFMDHPRARVAEEERSRGVPGRLLRLRYRSAIERTVRKFRHGLEAGGGTG